MAQHRYAARRQEGHGLGHVPAAFELDPGRAGLDHDPGGVAKGLLRRFLVAAKGQVDDDTGLRGDAGDRGAVGDHLVQGDREGVRRAVEHHAEGVADQDEVHMGIQQPRHGATVGGEANQRVAALAAPNVAYAKSLAAALKAHSV